MNIQITVRHVSVTDSLKNYVYEKVGKVWHYFDNITSTKVILDVEKDHKVAAYIVKVHGSTFVAKDATKDLCATIAMLRDKLTRQVDKHKNNMRCKKA
ncbi:ribosome hibernation-promoting factor, HPF/YfiA family [Francisella tularensis]|uniref:ribosome hibernation-promoting factor, HPF/YfiA family n=1 Tax=Francisella tularensis TaxID=263 RepID=UPI001680D45B|nr:ribosome-associated translation inhibitor RaiA [Francisella tularensis]MBD2809127.1 ribosome-associated translation inhibitor RaiA [Francisella tularensis]